MFGLQNVNVLVRLDELITRCSIAALKNLWITGKSKAAFSVA
jgi:hypothetical protein